MKVFLGITGASGAPYAKGILDGLVGAGAEVGLAASSAGIEVLATELYRDASLARDVVLERFVGDTGDRVTVYEADDWKSPYASGSAKVDAYVVCPCSMATVGTLASGAMSNLIHRAASVALKERRRLVLVPREGRVAVQLRREHLDAGRGRTEPDLGPGGGEPVEDPLRVGRAGGAGDPEEDLHDRERNRVSSPPGADTRRAATRLRRSRRPARGRGTSRAS